MNQPKFRGFSLETNSWHYGHGWKISDDKALLYTDLSPIECELDSMGQYTGIYDKNSKEAYHGDLFYWHGELRKVVYREDKGAFMGVKVKGYKSYFYLNDLSDQFEIIGNNTENHDLPIEISY
ncbi:MULTISPECIES: YopX family protein [Bacillus]|uniref:YopX family protein n=1 Tax=Bacillus TaxID=1386 RepID=UPI00077AC7F6|nr:YopX family protein [Bacillus cereus]